jgi:hypothetical protein
VLTFWNVMVRGSSSDMASISSMLFSGPLLIRELSNLNSKEEVVVPFAVGVRWGASLGERPGVDLACPFACFDGLGV